MTAPYQRLASAFSTRLSADDSATRALSTLRVNTQRDGVFTNA